MIEQRTFLLSYDLRSLLDYHLIFWANSQDHNYLETQEFFYLLPFSVILLLHPHHRMCSLLIIMLSCVYVRKKRAEGDWSNDSLNECVWPCFALAIRKRVHMQSRHMQQSSTSQPEADQPRQGIGFQGQLRAVSVTFSFRLKSGSVIFKSNLIRHSSIFPPLDICCCGY